MGTREEPQDLVTALGELADLRSRVDNAQRLAEMGDYDWHIESDTNTWSDQLYRIYGYEPGAIQASYDVFMQHIHPDDRDMVRAVHQQAYASGEPYEMVERIVRPDGELRYLASNGQVLTDANGTPIRFRGTCIDITDRVRAEPEWGRRGLYRRPLHEDDLVEGEHWDCPGYRVYRGVPVEEVPVLDEESHPHEAACSEAVALYREGPLDVGSHRDSDLAQPPLDGPTTW